jgi:hypothetical protein
MTLTEVTDKRTERIWLDIPRRLYKEDPNFICPLDAEIRNIFDPRKNKYFGNGEAIRWFLKDDSENLIGRIAAFYNKDKAGKYRQPTGGMGFFDCIKDRDAAFLLFDAAKAWLSSKGMEAMDGPINFGENDTFWGLLVEGFTPPAYGVNYNHPYYQELFEEYGFRPFFTQSTKHLDITVPFPERFWKIAEWAMSRGGIEIRHFKLDESEKFAADLVKVYNEAWVNHEHFSPITIEMVRNMVKQAKPILEEDFIWYAYHEGEPIAFMVMLPDVNQIFKHLNGKLNFINKLRFVYYKKFQKINRTRITILGVSPKFQGKGVESALFWHLNEPLLEKRPWIHEIEVSWVGDFNPKMQALLNAMNPKPGKTHITYRKLFSETAEAQYAARIDGNS